jgi:MSHA biogenesis protein MshG
VPVFAYKGRNPRGELVQGTLENVTSNAVADQLFNNSITPIEIKLAPAVNRMAGGGLLAKLMEKKISAIDILMFSRQMHTLLRAGVPIMRALAGLQESTINKAFAAMLQELRDGLDAGRELSAAMRRQAEVFSPFYVSMVRVGELTGRLEEIFLQLFFHLDFERRTREQIKAALRYPSFVIVAIVAAIVVINIWVIPAFAKVYAGFKAELPFLTKVLIGMSNFMLHYWPLLLMGTVAAIIGFRFYIKTPTGKYKWDKFKLHLPIVGDIVKKATLARFSRSLALAMKSGVPIVQGLSVVSLVVDNDYIAQRIEQMRDGVERGETILRTAVTAGVFTPVVLQMIAVGEETGAIDELMEEIAGMYDQDVEYQVKNLSANIEPILIVAIGGMVLILALGVFLPIWDLGQVALHK